MAIDPISSALLLAAGRGTRLAPLTDQWPKCLMPIHGRAILEHWLCILSRQGIVDVVVNVHHHHEIVKQFLAREIFRNWVSVREETALLGTAGTLQQYVQAEPSKPLLVIHADNWCQCDFSAFVNFHQIHRPRGAQISMMTFRSDNPQSCGIVEINPEGVVVAFHEKVSSPPGNLANGAVYIFEPEALDWLRVSPRFFDISNDVLPRFLGKIATWENTGIHRDIGTVESLKKAQLDPESHACWTKKDSWQTYYERLEVFGLLDATQ